MAKKAYADFEELVARFFEKVEGANQYRVVRNAKIEGPDGPRQIDVLLEGTIGPLNVRTIIECKDFKGKVPVGRVDELASKMNDVKAHKAVLVSAKGFSKTAIRKAERLGIELCTLAEALSEKWVPKIDLPILVEEITPAININFQLFLRKGSNISRECKINGIDVFQAFETYWNARHDLEALPPSDSLPEALGLVPPYTVTDPVNGSLYRLDHLSMQMEVRKVHYFGNLSELPNTMIMQKVINRDQSIIIEAEHLLQYRERFSQFQIGQEIPNKQAFVVYCVAKPVIHYDSGNVAASARGVAKT